MLTQSSGFEELPHTADWALRVWAPNLPNLFAQAAQGMNSLAGVQPAPGARLSRVFEAKGSDLESLLVLFLSELVFLAEQEHLVFDAFEISLNGLELKANMSGAPVLSLNKPVKAVTYHNLQIRTTPAGFEVEIVFDV
ncbi:MAG: archease [Anaerolineales bacterium]|jgi:SHS2 domain-containing protein